MQALNASNAVLSKQKFLPPRRKGAKKTFYYRVALCALAPLREKNLLRNLPMINQKKTSELIETSLIYLLSAAVAVGAFVLVWLVSLLLGPSQT